MTFFVKYTIYDNSDNEIKSGGINVYRKPNKFVAQVELEKYLKRKHPNMSRMVVQDIIEDNVGFMKMWNEAIIKQKHGI